jgi:hypothetical protein
MLASIAEFSGRIGQLCADSVTAAQIFRAENLQPQLSASGLVGFRHCLRESCVMARPAKAIVTVASLAVLASFVFAVSWVGLALLGY